jgi:hypothetical protein
MTKQEWLEIWKLSGDEGEQAWQKTQEMHARGGFTAPQVMPDIPGYKSMQTGEWISSRSQHRAHLKQHRLIELGNEQISAPRRQEYDSSEVKRELAKHLYR